MRSCEIFIEGIGAARAVEKIVQGGVPVLAARVQKKGVTVRVDGKHREKVLQFCAVRVIMEKTCVCGASARRSSACATGGPADRRGGVRQHGALFSEPRAAH